MQHYEQLVNTIITYTKVLSQSMTPCVATWKPFFIQSCIEWSLLIETELVQLDTQETTNVINLVKQKDKNLKVPSTSILMNALHTLFFNLIQNVYTSNELYLYLIKNYHFLTMPEENILQKDLTVLANKAATIIVLSDILDELSSL